MTKKRNRPQIRPLTFGKHRGVPLGEVPRDYLEWVLKTVAISERVEDDIRAVLMGQRQKVSNPPPIKRYREPERTSKATTPRWVPWDDSDEPGPEGEIESRLKEEDIPY
jgi:hypothetical protein